MRIGINATMLGKGERITGIGNFVLYAVKEILKQNENDEYFLFCNQELCFDVGAYKNAHEVVISCKSKQLLSRYLSVGQIRKYKLDVYWSPTHNLPFIRSNKTKYYMTIHDIANYKFSGISKQNRFIRIYFTHILRDSCKAAYKIFADSLATKRDVDEYCGFKNSKVHVVYGGSDFGCVPTDGTNAEETLQKYRIDAPYFLYVGTLQPRKNISLIVRSYIEFRKTNPEHVQLVLTGGSGWGMEEVNKLIDESKFKEDIIRTGYISDEEKDALYRKASVFLFPSMYEGYGIPVFESFQYGLPVITANNSSLPEVGGDAAFYINDVDSVPEMLKQMERVINLTPVEKESVIQREKEQLAKFSWEKCAEEICELWKD
ncbi:MAG: glycosyltransferase family 4 protein [Ruminococcus sp.]|nr:glycosyltransferase family 4 protein [Ruminococcus sp.]